MKFSNKSLLFVLEEYLMQVDAFDSRDIGTFSSVPVNR